MFRAADCKRSVSLSAQEVEGELIFHKIPPIKSKTRAHNLICRDCRKVRNLQKYGRAYC